MRQTIRVERTPARHRADRPKPISALVKRYLDRTEPALRNEDVQS